MNHVFDDHIDRTVEAYVDDIMVKTKKIHSLVPELETTFACLQAKSIKFITKKCVFGVS
jgi:hypothetical protein